MCKIFKGAKKSTLVRGSKVSRSGSSKCNVFFTEPTCNIKDLFKNDLGVTEPFPTKVLFVSGINKVEKTRQIPEPIAKNQKIALQPHLEDNPAPINAPNAVPTTWNPATNPTYPPLSTFVVTSPIIPLFIAITGEIPAACKHLKARIWA